MKRWELTTTIAPLAAADRLVAACLLLHRPPPHVSSHWRLATTRLQGPQFPQSAACSHRPSRPPVLSAAQRTEHTRFLRVLRPDGLLKSLTLLDLTHVARDVLVLRESPDAENLNVGNVGSHGHVRDAERLPCDGQTHDAFHNVTAEQPEPDASLRSSA